jgi:hypothetical protein
MDILKMIAELHAERAAIDEALVVLQRLAKGRSGRRGRPPAWMALVHGNSSGEKTRTLSAETRKRMAEAQRRRWAAYRKEQEA